MKMRHEITTATLLLAIKIVEINAGCYWNFGAAGTECLMYCIRSDTTAVNKEIENLYNEEGKEDCRNNGIWLRLQTLPYPNSTIGSHWFTAEVKVFELEVHLNDVNSVSADAFNSNAFRTVKKLLLKTLSLEVIRNGTFNGLDELEEINISEAESVITIERGVLNTLTELKKFTFVETSNNVAIRIDGLTGSEPLLKLEHVKIKYNLASLIRSSTFIGLTNVKYLDLSNCKIDSIEEYSFDPIANSIEELNLSANRLTTVQSELFNTILLNIKMIHINGNSWHCDCKLLPFRLIVQQYQYNFTDSNCVTPPGCSTILGSDCFDECEIPPTTASSTTKTTYTTTTTTTRTTTVVVTTDFPNENLIIQCYERNKLIVTDSVSIRRPISYMTIKEDDYGEFTLNIEYKQDDASFVIIWFSGNQNSGDLVDQDIHCISENATQSIPITKLVENVAYSFCLMDKTSTNVSPLDCISYMKRMDRSDSVWLLQNSKTLIVILIVLSLLMNIGFGIAVGLWMFNYSPCYKQKSRTPKFSIHTIDSDIFNPERKGRLSNMTSYTNSTTLPRSTSSQYGFVNSPPLPERPPNMKIVEEPVYASVEEIYQYK